VEDDGVVVADTGGGLAKIVCRVATERDRSDGLSMYSASRDAIAKAATQYRLPEALFMM